MNSLLTGSPGPGDFLLSLPPRLSVWIAMSSYEELISMNKCSINGQPTMADVTHLAYLSEELIFLKHLLGKCLDWMGTVALVIFGIPLFIIFLLYLSALFLLIYQKTHNLKGDYYSNVWDDARLILSTMWDKFARFWNGYELHGTENLPDGPALLIYYHGAIPVDYLYFLTRYFILKRRCCYSIADDYLFRFPGIKSLTNLMHILPSSREECLNILKNGHLLGISPGGVREALFSDESYKLVWHKRKGFAHLALDAKVPIIPMYTQNVREGFRVFGRTTLARWVYEHSRLPILPPYGGLPVKFRTYIGEPIPYDPNITAAELAAKTKAALQSLIRKHQQIPGNMFKALMDRFHNEKEKD
ncbi:monoacylglycerol/Diacylglycerol O-acyltransferase isoform X1 [Anolis carolinensis]|uniref:Phospholipid/glycerol acyltransferase domain-containing protein n=2 Tax=Anolis carolinensis TaxID=28377 RepID=R4GCM9_ANOCA|nr:PREDICTED: transmembrane protein 68 isoform X1 [Anolis carolinensis]|eukprot:XP_003224349.2 PREDICTED: transmembrane protein 68 isoform X1 [Anolis carolinensis]